jgi:hypothetical protein
MSDFISIITSKEIDIAITNDVNGRIRIDDITKSVINLKADKFYYIISSGFDSGDLLNPLMDPKDGIIEEFFETIYELSKFGVFELFVIEDDGTLNYLRDLQFMIDNALGVLTISLIDLKNQFLSLERFVLYRIDGGAKLKDGEKLDTIERLKKADINKYLLLNNVKQNQFIYSILTLPEELMNNNKYFYAIVVKIINLLDKGLSIEKIETEIYKSVEYLKLKNSEIDRHSRIELIKKRISLTYNYNDPYYVELMLVDNIARSVYIGLDEVFSNLEYNESIKYIEEQCKKYRSNSPIIQDKIYLLTVMGYDISIIDLSYLLSIIGFIGELGHPLKTNYFEAFLTGAPIDSFDSEMSVLLDKLRNKKEGIIRFINHYLGEAASDVFLNGLESNKI